MRLELTVSFQIYESTLHWFNQYFLAKWNVMTVLNAELRRERMDICTIFGLVITTYLRTHSDTPHSYDSTASTYVQFLGWHLFNILKPSSITVIPSVKASTVLMLFPKCLPLLIRLTWLTYQINWCIKLMLHG